MQFIVHELINYMIIIIPPTPIFLTILPADKLSLLLRQFFAILNKTSFQCMHRLILVMNLIKLGFN